MANQKYFKGIGFEGFRALAQDKSLSKYEKIGFPDSYRSGFEEHIFVDILKKADNLLKQSQRVLDIGPGCSDLPCMLIKKCREHSHTLALIDSKEMLDNLPEGDFIFKKSAIFPRCPDYLSENEGKLDVVICYSVLHYALLDTAFFKFLDSGLALLSPGGQFLIGDIPNVSKRKRFFASEAGQEFHKRFMKTASKPEVVFNNIEHDQIDDSIVMAIVQRARAQGFDAYVLPQPEILPMANRREDILIVRP